MNTEDIYQIANLFYKLASKKFDQHEEEIRELVIQKHPKIKKFLKNILGKDIDLNDENIQKELMKKLTPFVENGYELSIKAKNIPKLKNLANKPGDEKTLKEIEKISGDKNIDKKYEKLMKERDSREDRSRNYEVIELLGKIRSGKYHPPTVLAFEDGLYVIDGRTRLYAALALNIDPKIKIITKDNLKEIEKFIK